MTKKMINLDYRKSGVDLELGDLCSKIFYEASKLTWKNRKNKIGQIVIPIDDFSGIRYIEINNLKDSVVGINYDGIGTKIEIAERLNEHTSIAQDLFAMVCDDAAIRGAEPILLGSIIDFKKLDKKVVEKLAKGMVKAAQGANVAVINGEIAELGYRIGGYRKIDCNYNWGGAVLWIAKKNRIINIKDIKKNDLLIGVKENSFRSNGYSLIRKILEKEYGYEWQKKVNRKFIKQILKPSIIYSNFICNLTGGYNNKRKVYIKGMAHITGGGIPGKLGRILKPLNRGAFINNPFNPPEIMIKLQSIGKVADFEAYKAWNMGTGLILISNEYSTIKNIAEEYGYKTKIIGHITDENSIVILNKGAERKIKYLIYKNIED
jgi:phosphoribosylformylglycinamidine cyclo-ligase